MLRQPFRLVHDLLIPVETEPFKPFEYCRGAFIGTASFVRILDAEKEGASIRARKKPVEQCCTRAAYVEKTCGGWRETDTRW
jgi:hypothetical protein